MTKKTKKWLGLLLAIAFTFNALMPFFADYSQAHKSNPLKAYVSASMKLASVFGEKILICTENGFALVSIKDLLAGKIPVKPHKSFLCALCFIAANPISKLLLFAVALVFLLHRKTLRLFLVFRENTVRKYLMRSHASPRAPPAFLC